MGQISPLDQLISNSAFNDCSVTVIYSGVIITDVLLLRDCPSAPLPSLFCADVIVFSGATHPVWSGPAPSTVALCVFRCFKFCLSARLPRWPDPGTRVTASPDQRDCQAFANPHRPQRSLVEPDKHLPSTFHTAFNSLYHLPFTTRCAYMCEFWVSTLVSNTFVCTVCECVWGCVHRLSEFVFYPAGTHWWQPLLEPLWLSAPFFFFSPELKKLEFSPMINSF